MDQFETALLVLGALLMGGALVSGRRAAQLPVADGLFVLAGFVLGEAGLEVLEFDATQRRSSRTWRSSRWS